MPPRLERLLELLKGRRENFSRRIVSAHPRLKERNGAGERRPGELVPSRRPTGEAQKERPLRRAKEAAPNEPRATGAKVAIADNPRKIPLLPAVPKAGCVRREQEKNKYVFLGEKKRQGDPSDPLYCVLKKNAAKGVGQSSRGCP